MGDPGKIRQKFDTPSHPWQRDRIEVEKALLHEYGLKNKREIWKAETLLRSMKNQAKSLASKSDEQAMKERKQLLDKLVSMSLLQHGDSMDKILSLSLKQVMDRRLQAFLVRKGLARTMKQARQFITHGHVTIDGKKITFPNHFVTLKDESAISFMAKSSLAREDHPERVVVKKESKDDSNKKRKKQTEEVPPAFNEAEIEQIEEKGAVEAATESEPLN